MRQPTARPEPLCRLVSRIIKTIGTWWFKAAKRRWWNSLWIRRISTKEANKSLKHRITSKLMVDNLNLRRIEVSQLVQQLVTITAVTRLYKAGSKNLCIISSVNQMLDQLSQGAMEATCSDSLQGLVQVVFRMPSTRSTYPQTLIWSRILLGKLH